MYHVQFPGLGLSFNIDPVAFQFGIFTVRWYGIMIAIGFILAFLYVIKACKRYNMDVDKFVNVIIVGLVTGIVGARLYYVIFFPGDQYIVNPISIFYINEGGLAIYGGIIGGIITAKLQKIDILTVLDLSALGFLIGQSFGRWGNFFNQEAFGVSTDLPWGMISENTFGETVHPCFLYESIWCAVGFVLLHFFSKRYQTYRGQLFFLYLIWYGTERFFVEGLRTDSLYLWNLDIRVSQALSLLIIIFAIVAMVWGARSDKAKPYQTKVPR